MTKRVWYSSAAVLMLLIAGAWSYSSWKFSTYPEHAIRDYTGISDFTVISKVHNEYEWYATVRIQPNDVDALLQRLPFQMGFSRGVVGGKILDGPVPDCMNCRYYFDNEHGSAYDYRLLVLSGDKTELLVYEVFGN